jgi:hypothetical protein
MVVFEQGCQRRRRPVRLTGLPPGSTFKLTATRTGFARTTAAARTSPAGQPPQLARIVMEDGQTAFGRVVDESDRPIAGAEVTLYNSAFVPLKAGSDEAGRFEFRYLSPGRISVRATHPGRAPGFLDRFEIPSAGPAVDLGALRLPPGEAIEGRVTDTRGTPIEGATVSVTQESERAVPWQAGFSESAEPLRTDVDGTFRAEGLEGGKRFHLWIRHESYVEASFSGVQAPTEEPLHIEMKAARNLSGQVVGSKGEPVAEASLAWVKQARIGGVGHGTGRPLGTTDADGRFRATGLPAGSIDLEVTAEAYASRRIEGLQIPADRDPEDVRIVLQPATFLDARVLTAAGEPVADATVNAEPIEPDNEQDGSFSLFMELNHTDTAGRCRVKIPRPGVYRVSATRRGNPGNPVRAQVMADAGATPVELRFPPDTEVSGQVVGEDGLGVPGASVRLAQSQDVQHHVQTEADGRFSIPHVVDGEYRLTAFHKDLTSEELDLSVRGQPVRGIELHLDRKRPGATLTGRILGLPPEDLSRVFVRAFRADDVAESVQPDREGIYRFERLSPGEWRVEAHVFRERSAWGEVEIPPGVPAVELNLEFKGDLTLTGRISVDGSLLSGAAVRAWTKPDAIRTTRTAYDGTFTLPNLTVGSLTLIIVSTEGFGGSRTLRLTESQQISIELSTGRLTGRVLSTTGEPVVDAAVSVEGVVPALRTSFSVPGVRTAADGTFEIPRLVTGTYKLTIAKEGFAPAERTVEVPAGNESIVEIQLKSASAP